MILFNYVCIVAKEFEVLEKFAAFLALVLISIKGVFISMYFIYISV